MTTGNRSKLEGVTGRRRRMLLMATAIAMVASMVAATPAAADELDRHIVARLSSPADLDLVLANHDLRVVTALVPSRGLYVLTPNRPVEKKDDAKKAAKELEKDGSVRWAEVEASADGEPDDDRFHAWPNGAFTETDDDVVAWRQQPALRQLNLDAVHRRATGAGITVAILDTGIDLDHPQLVDHLASDGHYDYVDDDVRPIDVADGFDDDGDGVADDAYGHGTHAAGLVALVAPDAEIVGYRVLNADGTGDPYVIALAVHDAIDAGADVINISFGMAGKPKSKVLKEAFKRAKKENVVVVAAVGNNGEEKDSRYPAYEKDVIGVAAAGDGNVIARFSNHGKAALVAAPGEQVVSTLPNGEFGAWSGTSMAAPIVSGQAALVLEVNPQVKVKKVIERVGKSSIKLRGSRKINKGYIDILRSLED